MFDKKAFTLAEALITLGVVGVVAAVVIPTLMNNVQDYTFAKAKENSLAKITEATKEMKSNDVLAGYTTNSDFVDAFSRYMTVIKRCDSSNLTGCFPPKFRSGTEDISTNTLTTGTKLGANNITGNTIAMMLKNGTSLLFTLRDSTKVSGACDRIDPFNNTSDTNGCMSFLYDINGYGPPNVIGKDIGAINAAVTSCGGAKFNGVCFGMASIAPPMSNATCTAAVAAGTLGITECPASDDYWAGAVAKCGGVSKLPTKAQAALISDYLLGLSPGTCPSNNNSCSGTFDVSRASALGLPTTGWFIFATSYIYTNGTTNNYTHWRTIEISPTTSYFFGDGRYRPGAYTICIE